jgi:hypothetical protein
MSFERTIQGAMATPDIKLLGNTDLLGTIWYNLEHFELD